MVATRQLPSGEIDLSDGSANGGVRRGEFAAEHDAAAVAGDRLTTPFIDGFHGSRVPLPVDQ